MDVVRKGRLILGCIADDFTGGSDAASFLAAGGMRTILLSGIPEEDYVLPADAEAVVITLKSRTQETEGAVSDSLRAVRWMRKAGASHFYMKYCSTFDSTPRGNIGPVVDALLEELGVPGTILCPALPANERIVRDGILYVKGVPLSESPMKDHPLTPMWESRISALMAPQGRYGCLELHRDALQGSGEALAASVEAFRKGRDHWYLVPDCTSDADALRIVELFGDMPVLTGGSGILTPLAERLKTRETPREAFSGTAGPALIVAGSCSTATHAQTRWYEDNEGFCLRLSDEGVLDGTENPAFLWKRVHNEPAPLIYAYDTPEGLAKKRSEAGRTLAGKIEDTLSGIAALAVQNGVTRIISAGGETSGAVTKALGWKAFRIGPSVAPGVPVMIPVDRPDIRLVLKSGNFGQEDFFARALALTAKNPEEPDFTEV